MSVYKAYFLGLFFNLRMELINKQINQALEVNSKIKVQ